MYVCVSRWRDDTRRTLISHLNMLNHPPCVYVVPYNCCKVHESCVYLHAEGLVEAHVDYNLVDRVDGVGGPAHKLPAIQTTM